MKDKRPTARQLEVLRFVYSYTSDHGFPPSLREIGKAFGFKSTNSVSDHLKYLERKGFIRRHAIISRSTVVTRAGFQALQSGEVKQ